MIRFVDEHKDRFGVESIIGVLRGTDAGFLSVPGYYAAKTRPPSAHSIADAALCEQISAVLLWPAQAALRTVAVAESSASGRRRSTPQRGMSGRWLW